MLKEQIKDFMTKLDFPLDAQNELLCTFDKMQPIEDLSYIINDYDNVSFDFKNAIEQIKQIAEKNDINVYTANMIFLLAMLPKLQKKYNEKGIDDKIFYNTMLDFKYKLEECKLIHNCYGTFVPIWYKGFFDMRIFSLGRLQFEINNTWFDCYIDGVHIPKGTKVLSVHIPRTGTPLKHEFAIDAYNNAIKFFENEFTDKIIFICNSWLLYPWNRTIYKDGSNLAQFYDDFTIVSSGEYPNYSECWRLFDCMYDGNPDNLPANTSLRRAFIDRIKEQKPIGHGTGVIIFDK